MCKLIEKKTMFPHSLSLYKGEIRKINGGIIAGTHSTWYGLSGSPLVLKPNNSMKIDKNYIPNVFGINLGRAHNPLI